MITNFKCDNCSFIFSSEKRNNVKVSKCPNCSHFVAFEIIKVEKDLVKEIKHPVRRICDNCKATYSTKEDQQIRLCRSCDSKNKPLVNIYKPKELTKQDFKRIEFIKNLENKIKKIKENCDSVIYHCNSLGFSQDELKILNDSVIDTLTKCNKIKYEKINNL